MTDEIESIFDADAEYKPGNHNVRNLMLGTLVIAALYIVVDLMLNFKSERHLPVGVAIVVIIFVTVPIAGIILLAFRKKIGWIMSLWYYEFMSIMTGFFLAFMITSRLRAGGGISMDLKTNLLFVVSALSTIVLLTKPVRAYLAISSKMLVWTLSITTLVNIGLYILLFKG